MINLSKKKSACCNIEYYNSHNMHFEERQNNYFIQTIWHTQKRSAKTQRDFNGFNASLPSSTYDAILLLVNWSVGTTAACCSAVRGSIPRAGQTYK
jgi:hypothetical protein